MSDNIVVSIKARPLIDSEIAAEKQVSWKVDDRCIYQVDASGHSCGEPYFFDHIFNEDCSTTHVYNEVVKNNVKSAMEGFNLTIFAYGQTSSGKTYTMMGTPSTPGIIQLTVNDIFQYIHEHTEMKFLVSCAFFEIYNENVIDLLAADQKSLKIREDYHQNLIIDATEPMTPTPSAVMDVMNAGNKHRKVGSTKMNKRSSRSHSIFRIKVTSSENDDVMKMSYLYLVDLAGSERVAHTKAEGTRLKEGVNINKSLLVLGNVIRQLSEQEGFINYRDSKLTRILQPALGGNSKSLLITTVTLVSLEETKSSLEFAQRAKIVKNKPVVNQIQSHEDLTNHYLQSISTLEERVAKYQMEKEKAERELDMLKQGMTKILGHRDIGTEMSERKYRRFTVGSHELEKEFEIPPLNLPLTSGSSQSYVGDSSKREPATPSPSKPETLSLDDNDVIEIMKAKEEPERSLYIIAEETSSEILKITPETSRSQFLELKQSDSSDTSFTASETVKLKRGKSTPEYSKSQFLEPSFISSPTEQEASYEKGHTPLDILRKRAQELEESYESLKEFTSFEGKFTAEEGGFIKTLLEEKDRLYNDFVSMEMIRKDEKSNFQKKTSELERLVEELKEENKTIRRQNNDLNMAKEVLNIKYVSSNQLTIFFIIFVYITSKLNSLIPLTDLQKRSKVRFVKIHMYTLKFDNCIFAVNLSF